MKKCISFYLKFPNATSISANETMSGFQKILRVQIKRVKNSHHNAKLPLHPQRVKLFYNPEQNSFIGVRKVVFGSTNIYYILRSTKVDPILILIFFFGRQHRKHILCQGKTWSSLSSQFLYSICTLYIKTRIKRYSGIKVNFINGIGRLFVQSLTFISIFLK